MKESSEVGELQGLSPGEAALRLGRDGYNEIASAKKRSVLHIAFEVLKEPMFLLLLAGGAIYMFLGDMEESMMLFFFVLVVMGITFYQERKTERALEALRDMSSPRALVIRGGLPLRIPGREVVVDDLVVLVEGDRVPADASVISSSNLLVDESLLTGESMPVRKSRSEGDASAVRPGGDDSPRVWSGTLVVQGHGVSKVSSTGASTELGKIGKALKSLEEEETPLRRQTGRLVNQLAAIGLALCVLVSVLYTVNSGRWDWVGGLLAGITLAMATLPEEIPVVFTIFMALGAWRMSSKGVLTRRMDSIESLGSATVLCVDKTGTLTMNHMAVSKLHAAEEFLEASGSDRLPERFHELVEYGMLASQTAPFDPVEKAIRRLGEERLRDTEHIHAHWTLVQEYPLSKTMLSISNVWNSPDGEEYVIAAKGAPEAIADLCHMDRPSLKDVHRNVASMAEEGLRILAVAKASFKRGELPQGQHDFDFRYVGLIGFSDPVRPQVPAAIKECYRAGIRVIMITGDYPVTAKKIAEAIGLEHADEAITGPELEGMEEGDLRRRIASVNVFARVVPDQKLRIVEALKANGEIVAMTGDGVNDAPALKAAHIGVAMGGRGTDVARESASIVLLDDDFSSIVAAARLGRRIFDNLRKALAYIMSVHLPIAGMSLLPVVLKWPLALMPAHIAFLELVIDPTCSVVFEAEAEEEDVMRRPPRRQGEPLLSRKAMALSILQGLMVLIVVANAYAVSLHLGVGEAKARTIAFTVLVFGNLGLIFTNRSWNRSIIENILKPNRALRYVFAGTVSSLLVVLYLPPLTSLFKFAPLSISEVATCFLLGALSVAWFEGVKMLDKRLKFKIL